MAMTSPTLLTAPVSLQAIINCNPLPAVAFQLTPQAPLAAINRAAEELTGYSWGDVSRHSLIQFISPEDRSIIEPALRRLASLPNQTLDPVRLTQKAGLVLFVSPTLLAPSPSLTIAGTSYGFCIFEEARHARQIWEASTRRFGSSLSPVPAAKESDHGATNGALTYTSLIDVNRDLRDSESRLYKKLGDTTFEDTVEVRMTGEMAPKVLQNGYPDTFHQSLNLYSRNIKIPNGRRLQLTYSNGSGKPVAVLTLSHDGTSFKKLEGRVAS